MSKMNLNTGSLLSCILEIIIGILLLINPVGFTSAILVVLGVALTVLGIISVIKYFRTDPVIAHQENSLAKGIIYVIIGLFFALRSEWFILTFPLLTVLYGVMTLLMGVSKVEWAVDMLRLDAKYWFVALISAVLTLLFAVLILVNPFAGTAALWTFIAVSLIIEAVIDIVAFILGRVTDSNSGEYDESHEEA